MFDLYLEPEGFLGTGASFLADLTLIGYIAALIPSMLAGFAFARRKMYRPHHKHTMIALTTINWLLIVVLMMAAYRYDVVSNIFQQPANLRYLLPTIHGALGLVGQLLATYVVLRMLREDAQVAKAKARGESDLKQYFFLGAKPVMRMVLVLWLVSSTLGIGSYLIRYNLIDISPAGVVPAPAVTPEVTPESTQETTVEVSIPAQTPEPVPQVTPELTPEAGFELSIPVQTPEIIFPQVTPEAPVATEEIREDNSGPGSRNSGRGSDNSGHGGGDDDDDRSGRGGGDDDEDNSGHGGGGDDD